jgi:hypothetical protein
METDMKTVPLLSNSVNSRPVIDTFRQHPDIVALFTTGLFRPRHVACQELLYRRSTFYQALKPVDAVQQVVERFYSVRMRRHLAVGLHVRVNAEFDYAHIPDFDSHVVTWDAASPVELFEQVPSRCVRRVSWARLLPRQRVALLALAHPLRCGCSVSLALPLPSCLHAFVACHCRCL